jgi:hypothetical protein
MFWMHQANQCNNQREGRQTWTDTKPLLIGSMEVCHWYIIERNLIVLKFGYQITFSKSNSTTTNLFELRQTHWLRQKWLSLALPAIIVALSSIWLLCQMNRRDFVNSVIWSTG